MATDMGYAYFNTDCLKELDRERANRYRLTINQENDERSDNVTNEEDLSMSLSCALSTSGVCAPILDYEIVEKKHTFTIYKIHVVTKKRNWFVFRRYSDFLLLNNKLRKKFPCFRVNLPKKKYFGNNYDPNFLFERMKGLQLFLNTLLQHDLVCQSEIVENFLCLRDPPGPYDSLEESRAFCQQMEATVNRLKARIQELESELSATKSSLSTARIHQEVIVEHLRRERAKNHNLRNEKNELERRLAVPELREVISETRSLLKFCTKDDTGIPS